MSLIVCVNFSETFGFQLYPSWGGENLTIQHFERWKNCGFL